MKNQFHSWHAFHPDEMGYSTGFFSRLQERAAVLFPGEEKGKGGEPTSENWRGKQGYSGRKSKRSFCMPVLDAFLGIFQEILNRLVQINIHIGHFHRPGQEQLP